MFGEVLVWLGEQTDTIMMVIGYIWVVVNLVKWATKKEPFTRR